MKTNTIISAVVAAAAMMVSTASAEKTCEALYILDACLETTQGYLTQCSLQDFGCLCEKYTTIKTCFDNCPDDQRQYAVDSQRQLNCANAAAFPSTTTTLPAATKTSASTANESSPAPTTTPGDDKTPASATPSPSDAAGADDKGSGAGALQAGFFGAFAGVAVAALL